MKALIQRVMNAKVTVNGEVVSNIEQGLCVLIGISRNDNMMDMEYIVRKILSVRLFDDESGKRWNKTVVEKDLELLCVSQFTLYNTWKGNEKADQLAKEGITDGSDVVVAPSYLELVHKYRNKCYTLSKEYFDLRSRDKGIYIGVKGNKPDFHNAMGADESKKFYEQFLELLKKSYKPEKIKDGVFGAYMQVSIQNDGPVTLEMESPVRDEKKLAKESSRNPQRAKIKKECEGDMQS